MSKIIKSNEAKSGYSIIINEIESPLNSVDKSGEWIILPENPENRKYIKISKLEKNGNELELTPIDRSGNPQSKSSSKSSKISISNWLDYLNAEERLIIEDLKSKALNRMTDPKELARLKYEKAKMEYERLMAEEKEKEKENEENEEQKEEQKDEEKEEAGE